MPLLAHWAWWGVPLSRGPASTPRGPLGFCVALHTQAQPTLEPPLLLVSPRLLPHFSSLRGSLSRLTRVSESSHRTGLLWEALA